MSDAGTRCLPARFCMVAHLFASFIICNMDRVNVAVAIVPMGDALKWTQSTRGVVQASFFAGYMLTQIPGGRIADAVGGRRVLAVAVAVWSVLTALTPLAARFSFPMLVAARVTLGLAEGFAMPAVNSAVAVWVPVQETARSLSFIYSGMYAGSILGLLASPALLMAFGWPALFYVFGAVGLAWTLLFAFTTSNSPSEAVGINDVERAYILANAPASRAGYAPVTSKSDIEADFLDSCNDHAHLADHKPADEIHNTAPPTLRDIFSRPCVWAIIVAHFCCTWGYFVLLTWLPSYLHMRFHLDISHSSLLSITPWVSMFIAANIGGYIADFLLARGADRTTVRKLMQSIAFLGPAFFLAVLARAESAMGAIVAVSAALAFAALSNSGVYSNHHDIGPRVAGTLLGVSNAFASIPGVVGVAVTGFILDKTGGNWAAVFHLAIAFYAIGFIVYNLFATAEKQWD